METIANYLLDTAIEPCIQRKVEGLAHSILSQETDPL